MIKNCQMCGACGVSCNYAMDMEVMEPIQEYRIQSVKDGKTVAALNKAVEMMQKDNTMVSGSTIKRGEWSK